MIQQTPETLSSASTQMLYSEFIARTNAVMLGVPAKVPGKAIFLAWSRRLEGLVVVTVSSFPLIPSTQTNLDSSFSSSSSGNSPGFAIM